MQDEPKIMSKVAKLLEPLDAAARSRILGWAISALDVQELRRTSGWAGTQTDANISTIAEQPKLSAGVEDWLFSEQDYADRK